MSTDDENRASSEIQTPSRDAVEEAVEFLMRGIRFCMSSASPDDWFAHLFWEDTYLRRHGRTNEQTLRQVLPAIEEMRRDEGRRSIVLSTMARRTAIAALLDLHARRYGETHRDEAQQAVRFLFRTAMDWAPDVAKRDVDCFGAALRLACNLDRDIRGGLAKAAEEVVKHMKSRHLPGSLQLGAYSKWAFIEPGDELVRALVDFGSDLLVFAGHDALDVVNKLRKLDPPLNGIVTAADVELLEIKVADEVEFLRRERIVSPLREEDDVKPRWNKETHELRFKGQVIRKVRPIAKNVIRILDAFEEDGWPSRIDDPLAPSPETRRVSETLRTLNEGLDMIRFRADGTGEGIIWEFDVGE